MAKPDPTPAIPANETGPRCQAVRDASLKPTSDRWRYGSFVAFGLLALSAGSGELYGWPRLSSLEGPRVFWLLIPAALLQIPVLFECQRTALLTGRSLFASLGHASPLLSLIAISLMLFSFLWLGGWLSGSAAMIVRLFGVNDESLKLATNLTTIALAVLLGWPLWTHRLAAKYVSLMLKLFAVATFASAILSLWLIPDRAATLAQYLRETFTPHADVFSTLIGADEVDLVLCITFIGMGSWASVLYTGFASLSEYGRSETGSVWRLGEGRDSTIPGALSLLKSTGGLQQWYRHAATDTTVGVVLNLFCTAILAFLSSRLLFGSGNSIGTGYDLLSQQAGFFEPVFGQLARPLFIVIGSSFLLDTWLGFVPLMSKGAQEGLQISVPALQRWSELATYRAVLAILTIQSIITTVFAAPGSLIRMTAICLGVTHPIVILCLYYVNYRVMPRLYGASVRPSIAALSLLALSFVAYSLLALWYVIALLR